MSKDTADQRELQWRLLEELMGEELTGQRVLDIPRVRDRTESAPMSATQERLWIYEKIAGTSSAYNCFCHVELFGPLKVDSVRLAVRSLADRHSVLRTRFRPHATSAVQVIDDKDVFFEVVDFCVLQEAERANALRNREKREEDWEFDLSMGGLARFVLVRMSDNEHRLLVTMHHIITDGWSAGILMRDLAEIYQALLDHRPSTLPPLPVQYTDFSVWQRARLANGDFEAQVDYWRKQLAGLPVSELPADHALHGPRTFAGASVPFALAPALTERLNALARQNRCTLFMAALAAFQIVLARYTARDDVSVGSPVANRTRSEVEHLIGFFVNTLVLRAHVPAGISFVELLQQVRQTTLGAYANQDAPFERIVEELRPDRARNENPLFRIMFILHNQPVPTFDAAELRFALIETPRRTAPFDVTVSLEERDGALCGLIEYSTELFEGQTIARLAQHYARMLEEVVNDPTRSVTEIPILSEFEQHQLLVEWNGQGTALDSTSTVHAAIEAQAKRFPDAPAVLLGSEMLTYRQLNERANWLAYDLRRRGAGPEVLVGVCIERSLDLIVALLAVLKSGAAYVPIDPTLPTARLSHLLADCRPRIIVSGAQFVAMLPAHSATVIVLSDETDIDTHSENPQIDIHPDALMYVIYTSGSTGLPKGVGVSHRNVTSYLASVTSFLPLGTPARFSMMTTIAADLSHTAVYAALSTGGCLNVVPEPVVMNPVLLERHFAEHPSTIMKVTPSYISALCSFSGFARVLPTRVLMFGGEPLPTELVTAIKAFAPNLTILNHYGPTETTIGASIYQVRDVPTKFARYVSVGQPFSHCRMYVLDAHLELCVPGSVGELFISGAGTARGYLGQPVLTATSFLPDPFSAATGARMYRTGDRARWLQDGRLQILGRLDRQIKIRGFRIELEEIEYILRRYPFVRRGAVISQQVNFHEKQLIAYVEVDDTAEVNCEQIFEHMRSQLPSHAVPTYIKIIEHLPLTTNGKYDYASLTRIPVASGISIGQPKTATELRILKIWQRLLGTVDIGLDDDFFGRGGHSLAAVRLAIAIAAEFAAKIPPGDIFLYRTIRALAAKLDDPKQANSTRYGVLFQRGTSSTVLCCFPGNGGTAACYDHFAREFGSKPTIYGFEPVGLWDDLTHAPDTVEALAAIYFSELITLPTESQIVLIGHSFGGHVACELSSLLVACGRRPIQLILLDSAPAGTEENGTAQITEADWIRFLHQAICDYFGESSTASAQELSSEAPEVCLSQIVAFLSDREIVQKPEGTQLVLRLLDVFKANHRAARSYKPGILSTPVLLVTSSSSTAEDARRWQIYCSHNVRQVQVEGNHTQMIRPPYVKELVAKLIETLPPGLANRGVACDTVMMSPSG